MSCKNCEKLDLCTSFNTSAFGSFEEKNRYCIKLLSSRELYSEWAKLPATKPEVVLTPYMPMNSSLEEIKPLWDTLFDSLEHIKKKTKSVYRELKF